MEGNLIYLRSFQLEDASELLQMQKQNKHFFEQFSMSRTADYYSLDYQKHLIEQFIRLKEQGIEYHFGVFLKGSGQLIGTMDLFHIYRGSLQNAMIGYFLSEEHNGKGYASEACALLVHYAFSNLKLHRIEAGVMPRNHGSIRVLEKAGFHKEGIARKNVRIQGIWEDHQVLACLNPSEING
ncbi:GNAT family N-acetyltransferase [Alkalicoccobacillus murimartini]|uniref:Ribosomal-protein-alanine N-acetyltransferase n=1 Tax=Alkalicoccobacillus murimartini TaxID=171685 RepID=A0ABT9YEP3_9BACI|nr:GNAT family protein [Alkalicoccobacillus murimartini]MDQ0206011.1 ribosomal-protein-alanine N-acetyltransferase [Alkalicoccobacillus murimartini]